MKEGLDINSLSLMCQKLAARARLISLAVTSLNRELTQHSEPMVPVMNKPVMEYMRLNYLNGYSLNNQRGHECNGCICCQTADF